MCIGQSDVKWKRNSLRLLQTTALVFGFYLMALLSSMIISSLISAKNELPSAFEILEDLASGRRQLLVSCVEPETEQQCFNYTMQKLQILRTPQISNAIEKIIASKNYFFRHNTGKIAEFFTEDRPELTTVIGKVLFYFILIFYI